MNLTGIDAAVVVAVIAVIAAVWGFLSNFGKADRNIARKDEHPLNRDLVERHEFDGFKTEVSAMRQASEKRLDAFELKVDARFAEAAASSAGSRDKIYNSIRELEKQNSGQEAKLEIVLQTLMQMDGKIDRMRRE